MQACFRVAYERHVFIDVIEKARTGRNSEEIFRLFEMNIANREDCG